MPKRNDIKKILVIGSGPVVIGQGAEYDYSALEACLAIKAAGYDVVVIDSNPASAITDPELADKTYIEPLTAESVMEVIEKEKPDAVLPTMGGQVAKNLIITLARQGKLNMQVLGVDADTIERCQDRNLFKEVMAGAGIEIPKSAVARSSEEGMHVIGDIGFPAVIRPAYTAGGAGSAITYNIEEFAGELTRALAASPIGQVLIEESIPYWKDIELQLIRDSQDNSIVITSIESIDPVSVHVGDSTAVIPAQTIPQGWLDKMANIAKKALADLQIYGPASVKFGVNSKTGEILVVGVYLGATRGSALASAVTGIPAAYVGALIAVGYTLDEIAEEFAGEVCLNAKEPDYCAVRMRRFAFERFPDAEVRLGTSMKSVGDALGIGSSFNEALQKAMQAAGNKPGCIETDPELIREKLVKPNPDRLSYISCALKIGMGADEIAELSRIDQWFISNISELAEFEKKLEGKSLVSVSGGLLRQAKQLGFSDARLAQLLETDEEQVRTRRNVLDIHADFKTAGGCGQTKLGALYPAYTGDSKSGALAGGVLVIGSGPTRIGESTEFDYSGAQVLTALREEGVECALINSNPTAISSVPYLSDRLYMAPLNVEDVLGVISREKPAGVIAQFGGRALLNLAAQLGKAGVKILGTSPEVAAKTLDAEALSGIMRKLGLKLIEIESAASVEDALEKAKKIGYPVLASPDCAPGGLGTEIIYDDESLTAFALRNAGETIYLGKFIENAVKVGADVACDGKTAVVCGVMEHIEQAGIHSGDSACSLPPYSLDDAAVNEINRQARLVAQELGICGLANVQFAISDNNIHILEVNPRASRTIPFVSKATGIPWVKVAVKAILGKSLAEQGITTETIPTHISVKEAVFPFMRFPGVDAVLGPEMKSTGEVMGINNNFGNAFIKAEKAAGQMLPESGKVFLSVADADKTALVEIGKKLRGLGFEIVATRGTAGALKAAGVDASVIYKIGEGRPDATDMVKNGEIGLIINTPSGKKPRKHEITIRSTIVARGIPIITTIPGARATVHGMETTFRHGPTVKSLQEYNKP